MDGQLKKLHATSEQETGKLSGIRMQILRTFGFIQLLSLSLYGSETFQPYATTDEVPKDAIELWRDYNPRTEELDVRIIKQWKADGIVTRYVTFKKCSKVQTPGSLLIIRSLKTAKRTLPLSGAMGEGSEQSVIGADILQVRDLQRSTSTGWVARWKAT